jgi:uncharacterized protein
MIQWKSFCPLLISPLTFRSPSAGTRGRVYRRDVRCGRGFLMTPLLVFLGSPGVAVASSANYIAASSFSGALSYGRRRLVDAKLSAALLAGGLLETFSSIWLFQKLRALGQLDQVISSMSYLLLLTLVGGT